MYIYVEYEMFDFAGYNFRLTKTSEFGLYDFIDAIFGNDPNASRHALLNAKDYTMDTTEFWLNTSHQFDDLIDR